MSSIADIANEAGVSMSTVSLVANNKGNISHETRQRVEALLRRYAFRPRAKRGSKAQKQTAVPSSASQSARSVSLGTICVVCPQLSPTVDMPAGVYRFWAEALQTRILQQGGNFSYLTGELLAKNNQAFQKGLAGGMFKGVVLVGVEQGDGYVEATLRSGVPFVAINRRPLHGEFSSVGPDNFDGGRIAAKHLIALGHRHIGVISPGTTSGISYHTEARLAGFHFALRTHGLEPACELSYTPGSPRKDMDTLAKKVKAAQATAMFFTTDIQAISFIKQWELLGKQVPGDLSVVGFDHADLQTNNGLRLTTISHDSEQVAIRSIELIKSMMQSPTPMGPISEMVPVELITGDTSGPFVQK